MNPLYIAYCRIRQTTFRAFMPFLDWREPTVIAGPGALMKLPEIICDRGHRKVLLVTDAGLIASGLIDPFVARMQAAGLAVAIYDATAANPTIDNIEEALSLYLAEGCDALVAFGGGSPIDAAKAVGARIANPKKTISQMKGALKVRRAIPSLYVIPTTAGTGSEATLAAVVTDTATQEKYALNDPVLIPRLAILDPRLLVSLPKMITATTGIDALTHAIEAYIGHANTYRTRRDAREAVRLIFSHLLRSYEDGTDLDARGSMQKAAFLAGTAFTRAYVGNVHALAHTLGGFYKVAHGLANAVILPYILDFYGAAVAKPLAELAAVAGIADPEATTAENALRFIAAIRRLNTALGIPATISGVIRKEDIDFMTAQASAEANPLYPVPVIMGTADFRKIYELIAS